MPSSSVIGAMHHLTRPKLNVGEFRLEVEGMSVKHWTDWSMKWKRGLRSVSKGDKRP